MVKIGIAILLVGLVYSYGVRAEDTVDAVVDSIDASETKDGSSTSDSSDSKSDSAVDLANNDWMSMMPPMPPMPPMFQNFPGFRMPHMPPMPPMPRMPSLDDIENLAPTDEFSKVFGSGASFSSSRKVVNGEVVEDKQFGKVVTNNNGEVEAKEFSNDK